jgi:hypothetical protein
MAPPICHGRPPGLERKAIRRSILRTTRNTTENTEQKEQQADQQASPIPSINTTSTTHDILVANDVLLQEILTQMTETMSHFEQALSELFTMAERVIVAFQQQERHFNERKDTIVNAPAPPPAAATNDEDQVAHLVILQFSFGILCEKKSF